MMETATVTPYCVFAELVSETEFEIRQLLVGDSLLSPECWRASYLEFLFSVFDCGTLDNLKKEPRLVLQDGSVSSEALGGERHGSQTVCVRDG